MTDLAAVTRRLLGRDLVTISDVPDGDGSGFGQIVISWSNSARRISYCYSTPEARARQLRGARENIELFKRSDDEIQDNVK